jgi:NADH-quinone oxidoreductase subunit J
MLEQLTPLHAIFYLFASIATGAAVSVITARNPVRSVLSLVVTFFAMAGVWMILQAEFLSLILLLVYVGAVMTLFLFVVMMLNIDREQRRGGFVKYLPFGLMLIVLLICVLLSVASQHYFGRMEVTLAVPPLAPADYSNLTELGNVLYTDYAYPFEIAGVILLAAIIAAITLTFRGPVRRKEQNTGAQIAMRPQDSVRLVKMPSEPKPSQTGGNVS